MMIISENTINLMIEKYDDESAYLSDMTILTNEQKDLVAFLDQENYSLLTHDEMALLEYLSCIIYFSCKSTLQKVPVIKGSVLEKWEEANWDLFNTSNTKDFNKVLDIFFENYKQEDLLALIEDSIQQDEENLVTPVGSEIIFVACKSIIDTIDQLNAA
ncbi:MAG: hypothetical protein H7X99_05010 [Saprospiraceae bacterium]|nr:hypothetical protein [Saprospiraceae bacterium]